MGWLQLETDLGERPPEEIEALLEAAGAVAITLRDGGDNPLLEPVPGDTPMQGPGRHAIGYRGNSYDNLGEGNVNPARKGDRGRSKKGSALATASLDSPHERSQSFCMQCRTDPAAPL